MIGVRHFARLRDARAAALALAAREMAYEIDQVKAGWVVLVEEADAEADVRELDAFACEEQPGPEAAEPVLEPLRAGPLIGPALIWCGFFQAQLLLGERWTEAGLGDGSAILHGSWWRTITALTLHADLGHFLSNFFIGVLLAAFLQPQLGGGVLWLLFLLSGAAGNAVNAWGYRGEAHYSLGASTAVFGALGLLVGGELLARWRRPETRHRWQLIVPLGAGFSLLAYLGVGEAHEHIDFMAHCWGFLCGLCLGVMYSGATGGRRAAPTAQRLAGSAAVALIALAWWRATHVS